VPLSSKERQQLQNFGAAVRRERMARGLTQERLAELAGVNPRYIQKIEAGIVNVPLTTLLRIRGALKCPIHALIP